MWISQSCKQPETQISSYREACWSPKVEEQGQTEQTLITQSWSTRTNWTDVDHSKLKYKDKLNRRWSLKAEVQGQTEQMLITQAEVQGRSEQMLITQSWSTRANWEDVYHSKVKFKDKLIWCWSFKTEVQGQTEKILITQNWSARTNWTDIDHSKLKFKERLKRCWSLKVEV